jgi:hypothetical protein
MNPRIIVGLLPPTIVSAGVWRPSAADEVVADDEDVGGAEARISRTSAITFDGLARGVRRII